MDFVLLRSQSLVVETAVAVCLDHWSQIEEGEGGAEVREPRRPHPPMGSSAISLVRDEEEGS